jgi:hypothetical protein
MLTARSTKEPKIISLVTVNNPDMFYITSGNGIRLLGFDARRSTKISNDDF